MVRCAYCQNEATVEDAIGIPACAQHAHEADEYYEKQTRHRPDEDLFLYCPEHCDMWQPDCPRCEECSQHRYGLSVSEFLQSPLSEWYVFGTSDRQMKTMQLRGEFARKYCAEKGWNVNNLTIERLLEIRSKPEWKNPAVLDNMEGG